MGKGASSVGTMEQTVASIAALEARVENLEGWQKSQNGRLDRIDGKIDQLKLWIMGVLATTVVSAAVLIANLLAARGGN